MLILCFKTRASFIDDIKIHTIVNMYLETSWNMDKKAVPAIRQDEKKDEKTAWVLHFSTQKKEVSACEEGWLQSLHNLLP